MKKCPYCAEDIQEAAVVCKHCHRDLRPHQIQASYDALVRFFPASFRERAGKVGLTESDFGKRFWVLYSDDGYYYEYEVTDIDPNSSKPVTAKSV